MKDKILFLAICILTTSLYTWGENIVRLKGEYCSGIRNGKKWEICFDSDRGSGERKRTGGIVDGRLVIPCVYGAVIFAKSISGGPYFFVSDDSYCAEKELFDSEGNKVPLPRKFSACESTQWGSHHFLDVYSEINGETVHEIYNFNGELIIPDHFKVEEKKYFDRTYYLVKSPAGKYTYLTDENFKWILSPEQQLKKIEFLNDKSIILASNDSKTIVYNLNSGESFSLPYAEIMFSDDNSIIKVKRNGKYGLYDTVKKSEIIYPDFDNVELIEGTNFFKYKLNSYWGVMNTNGKEIIPTTRGYTAINYVKGLKKFTYSMYGYKGECNSLGTQLSKIAVPTNNTSNNTASSTHNHNGSTATSNSTSQQQGNQVREYIETVPLQVWQACGSCNGSGQCSVCYGSGWTIGYNGNKRSCIACHGTGKCTSCAGHGGQNVVRYEQRTVYR